jgi:Dolichyl-phosphate-mannose-protein mannosyltransferase
MPSSSRDWETPVIVSSEAAAEPEVVSADGDDRHHPEQSRSSGLLREYGPPALLALLVGALAVIMYSTHRSGHWWGDDWALYIRQAKGLLDGHPNRVLTQNQFTVDKSDGPAFSPPLYPWGFPIILAPFVAVVGDNLDKLTIVPVLCACLFACCWYSLARRRVGFVPALIGVAAVTITPLLLSWTELIQSEWPFLAVVGVALVCLDHVAASGALADIHGRIVPLAVVGLAGAAAFTVRREGLAMVGAIGAGQLAAIVAQRAYPWLLSWNGVGRLGLRLAVPYATFLATVGLLQVTLPSTVVPKYDGTSVTNVWKLRGRLIRNLAQVSGLQRPWDKNPIVLGSSRLGWIAVAVFLGLAVAGIVLSIVKYRVRDLHLAAYALGAFVIGGSFRSPINRYVCTVAPVLMILALVALFTIIDRLSRRWIATLVLSLALAAILAGNVANAHLRMQGATRAHDAGAIEWGPTHPDAIEMFDAVEQLTDPNDIVAAPKARAMELETGRPSIQVDDYRPIPPDVGVSLIVAERPSNFANELLDSPDQFQEVWANPRFVLFRPIGV